MIKYDVQVLEQRIKGFASGSDLRESCMNLLMYFGIQYAEIAPIYLDLEDIFDDKFFASHEDVLRKIDEIANVCVANQSTFNSTANFSINQDDLLNKLNEDYYKEMSFFCLEAKSELSRSEIALVTRAINRRMKCKRPVILFVRYNNLLSLATCERSSYLQKNHSGEKVGKVTILKNINCLKPHRGHLDILNSLDISKCNSFDEVYKNWLDTFSNELLTEKFYKELSNWYAWAIQKVRFPNDINDDSDDAAHNTENTIRMVTRLIFVWFLKEKGLIPEEFFDEEAIRKNFIEHFEPRNRNGLFYNADESKYYRVILQNLFFAMLNSPINSEDGTMSDCRRFRRKNADYNINNLMRYEDEFLNPSNFVQIANSQVPFLNGGLFDCLDKKDNGWYLDGFSDSIESRKALKVPDYLFFGGDEGEDVDLSDFYNDASFKHTKVKGLIEILSNYHFTVEENTPYEQEVSLDPELLGKVFENLLASFDESTQKTARKSTGSYYTPREVVQYMVDESLVSYLNDMVGKDHEEEYRKLISYADENLSLSDTVKSEIMRAIYNCKVLDPACGSGAFPVGMLQQMVHILSQIDPDNTMWMNLMKEMASKASGDAYREVDDDEERKAAIREIENNFDQSKKNPDYARKLYLIEHCIHGVDIQPIAIQISKLRFFISLVVDQLTTNDSSTNFGVQPLPNLEAKFVAADSLTALEKNNDIYSSSEIVQKIYAKMEIANHRIFKAKTNSKKKKAKETLEQLRQTLADTLLERGFVGQNAASQIADFNPFDQNKYAQFFDPEFMFGVKDGFDIIIGNPPYVSTKGREAEIKKSLLKNYGFADDLYSHFIFRSFDMLRDGGVQTMITSDTYFTTVMKDNVRKKLLSNSLLQLVHWGYDIFPAAMVSTATFLAKKTKPEENHQIIVYDMKGRTTFENAPKYEVPISKYLTSVNGSFFIPKKLCDDINEKYGTVHCNLLKNWLSTIDSSKSISKFATKLSAYRESLKPGDITLLGLVTDGGQGLATANNGKYVGVRSGTHAADNILESRPNKLSDLNKAYGTHYEMPQDELEIWKLFDALKEEYGRDVFGQGYLFRIVPDELIADYEHLSQQEKEHGIEGDVTFVPYDKGDKEGNRWYLATPYLIDWSCNNVTSLSTDPRARFQNTKFYFNKGFCYSDIKTFFLRCRLKGVSVHDIKSMSLFPLSEKVPYYYIITLINSHLMATIVYNFLNNTPSFQINDCRVLPVIIPTESQLEKCKSLFDRAIALQQSKFAGEIDKEECDTRLQPIQDEIDEFVYGLYGIETEEYLAHINKPYIVEHS